MANNQRMETEEEALFRTYPYALYFVQSPSTISRANSADIRNNNNNNNNNDLLFNSPLQSNHEVSRLALSRYSSSRGSNNDKKIAYDLGSHGTGTTENGEGRLICISHHHHHHHHGGGGDGKGDEDDDGDEEYYYGGGKIGWWWKYLSFRTSSSLGWICLQVIWRLMLSLGVALLVFYLSTRPPPPIISVKIAGIRQFGLGEGVDASGVATKILSFNCSMHLIIDNKSKLFGLHIRPPVMEMSFGKLPLSITHGQKMYAYSGAPTFFELYVGTMNKPMYGAGRTMQDMLESDKGVPIIIRTRLSSSFRVVWNFIKPKFHHRVECSLLLGGTYDRKHRTQSYKSSCIVARS